MKLLGLLFLGYLIIVPVILKDTWDDFIEGEKENKEYEDMIRAQREAEAKERERQFYEEMYRLEHTGSTKPSAEK